VIRPGFDDWRWACQVDGDSPDERKVRVEDSCQQLTSSGGADFESG
jgi:hypothetical protein